VGQRVITTSGDRGGSIKGDRGQQNSKSAAAGFSGSRIQRLEGSCSAEGEERPLEAPTF